MYVNFVDNMTHENQALHTLAAYMLRHTRHKGQVYIVESIFRWNSATY